MLWEVRGALVRDPQGETRWVPGWVDSRRKKADPDGLWHYLVDDKGGGNGYMWAVGGFRIADPGDAPTIASYYDTLYRQGVHPYSVPVWTATDADEAPMDRSRGLMLGLAVGNALGLPVEGRSGADVRRRVSDLGEIDPALRNQPWDDDVAQAVLIGEAVLRRGEMDLEDLAPRFIRWFEENGRGIGVQTLHVMQELGKGVPASEAARVVWERSGRKAAGNGAVMRCAPLAVRWMREPDRLVQESTTSARITHEDPRCQWSCAILNLALSEVIEGREVSLGDLARRLGQSEPPPEVVDAIEAADVARFEDLGLDGWDMGYTLKTMQVGLRVLVGREEFEPALLEVLSCGGDTDTNGAGSRPGGPPRSGSDSFSLASGRRRNRSARRPGRLSVRCRGLSSVP